MLLRRVAFRTFSDPLHFQERRLNVFGFLDVLHNLYLLTEVIFNLLLLELLGLQWLADDLLSEGFVLETRPLRGFRGAYISSRGLGGGAAPWAALGSPIQLIKLALSPHFPVPLVHLLQQLLVLNFDPVLELIEALTEFNCFLEQGLRSWGLYRHRFDLGARDLLHRGGTAWRHLLERGRVRHLGVLELITTGLLHAIDLAYRGLRHD